MIPIFKKSYHKNHFLERKNHFIEHKNYFLQMDMSQEHTYTFSSKVCIQQTESSTDFTVRHINIPEGSAISLTRCKIPDTVVNNKTDKILAVDYFRKIHEQSSRFPFDRITKHEKGTIEIVIPRGQYTVSSLCDYINLESKHNVRQCHLGIISVIFNNITNRFEVRTMVDGLRLNGKSDVGELMGFVYNPEADLSDKVIVAENPSSLLNPVEFSVMITSRENNIENTGSLYFSPSRGTSRTFAIPAELINGFWTYRSENGPKIFTENSINNLHVTLYCNDEVADISGYDWMFELFSN